MEPETLAWGRERVVAPALPTLREVFTASYRPLVLQLYGVVGDWAEAEDVVQEAFVRAAGAGRRFLRVDNHEAWLRTTAVNIHRNRWRKLRNYGRVRERLVVQAEPPPGVEEHLVLVEALQQLPEVHRQVLTLHYLADQQVSEIAVLLGIAEGTVKSRLNRGRAALAALLADVDGEEGEPA